MQEQVSIQDAQHSHPVSPSPARKRGPFIMRWIGAVFICLSLIITSPAAEAFMFHATRRAAARRIMKKGINPAKLKARTRFGKGFYLSRRKATALAEKGKRSTVIRMKAGRYLKRNILDLRNPTKKKIRALLRRKVDLRGKLKKRIIGPKLGRILGKIAGKKGKAIKYRSVKTKGTNIVIPKKLLKKRPRIVKPDKVIQW